MTKLKASLIHFVLSLFFVSSFLMFAYWVWYGQVFIGISGVIEPAKMLIIVDVVLGPFLTFLVYKSGKKNLKFDLGIIALVQVLALTYGAYTLYLGKPSVVAWRGNAFEIIPQKNILPELDDSIAEQTGVFSSPVYAIINPEKINNLQPVINQQSFLLPFSLSSALLEASSVDEEQARTVLGKQFDKWDLVQKLGKNASFLIVDDAWFGVLILEDGKPVNIIQNGSTEKE